jgi:hypothetical protein
LSVSDRVPTLGAGEDGALGAGGVAVFHEVERQGDPTVTVTFTEGGWSSWHPGGHRGTSVLPRGRV